MPVGIMPLSVGGSGVFFARGGVHGPEWQIFFQRRVFAPSFNASQQWTRPFAFLDGILPTDPIPLPQHTDTVPVSTPSVVFPRIRVTLNARVITLDPTTFRFGRLTFHGRIIHSAPRSIGTPLPVLPPAWLSRSLVPVASTTTPCRMVSLGVQHCLKGTSLRIFVLPMTI